MATLEILAAGRRERDMSFGILSRIIQQSAFPESEKDKRKITGTMLKSSLYQNHRALQSLDVLI